MKIIIIGSNNFDSLEYNLNESFNYNGHDCKIVDIYDPWYYRQPQLKNITRTIDVLGRRYSEKYDNNVFGRLAKRVLEHEPDLVIGVYRFIHPLFVKKIKNNNIKIIQINPDALTTFELQQLFVEPYDVYFTKDPYILCFMRDFLKLNVKLYNEAFNRRIHIKPDINKQDLEEKWNIDVLAFGNLYPYRNTILSNLKRQGISLSLYGSKCRFFLSELNDVFQHKYLIGQEKAEILYGSKIVFNNLHYAEIESVNNKFFEINGAGAFQLCDYRPILNDLLPIDPELVSYKNTDDAVEKIIHYMQFPKERYDICNVIYSHFQNRYSYDVLIDYILNNI